VEIHNDDVKHPQHYTRTGVDIECWDLYELALTDDEFRGAMKNNIIKYLYRAGHKDNIVKDLKKLKAYVNRWIEFEKGNRITWDKGEI